MRDAGSKSCPGNYNRIRPLSTQNINLGPIIYQLPSHQLFSDLELNCDTKTNITA